MKLHKLSKLAVILSVFTVLLLAWNVALAVSPAAHTHASMIEYTVLDISEPAVYWNLTDPDPHLKEAILNATYVRCYENETTFLQQVEEHDNIWKVRYEGHYYEIEVFRSYDTRGLPELYPIHVREHGVSGVILVGLWIPLITAWKRQQHI